MRMQAKSAFALASILTLTLAACAGDEDDITEDDDDDDDVSDTDDTSDEGDEGGEEDDADAAGEIESVDELVIALIPSTDGDAIAAEEERLAEALSEQLGGFPVRAELAQDYSGAVTALELGDVHIVFTGPVGMIQAEEHAGGVPAMQALRYGSDVYVTQWFTNDPDTYCLDEPVDVPYEEDGEEYTMLFCNGTDSAEYGAVGEEALELIDEGTVVSYVSEGSASGYYFPATQLFELHGFVPGSGDIDEQFAGNSHPTSVLNVFNGNAPVGTSFDDARQNVVEEEPTVGEEVVVFAWAGPIPNDGIVFAGEGVLTDDERQILTDAFLAMADTDEGVEILDAVYEIDGLVEADQEALDAARDVYSNFPE